MKILAISDIHGNENLINKIKKYSEEVDAVVYCGDLSANLGSTQDGLRDASKLMATFDEIDKPCVFIRGNLDGFELNNEYYLASEFGINGESFVPFESILSTPFGTYREIGEEQMAEELALLGNANGKIIVAHNPPFGVLDEISSGTNVGSKSILEFIKTNKPKIYLCGHIHEAFGKATVDSTLVLNCASMANDSKFRGWIVDTDSLATKEIID